MRPRLHPTRPEIWFAGSIYKIGPMVHDLIWYLMVRPRTLDELRDELYPPASSLPFCWLGCIRHFICSARKVLHLVGWTIRFQHGVWMILAI